MRNNRSHFPMLSLELLSEAVVDTGVRQIDQNARDRVVHFT
jgi:hypothetical protein